MGHLDGRMTEDKTPSAQPQAGVKDGPKGQKSEMASKKDDAEQHDPSKASDVIGGGGSAEAPKG